MHLVMSPYVRNVLAVIQGGGYSPTIPTWVCVAQQGCDFGTTDLEQGIHFRDVS